MRKIFYVFTVILLLLAAGSSFYAGLPAEYQFMPEWFDRYTALIVGLSTGGVVSLLLAGEKVLRNYENKNIQNNADNNLATAKMIERNEQRHTDTNLKIDELNNLIKLLLESKAENPFTKNDIKEKIKEVFGDEK